MNRESNPPPPGAGRKSPWPAAAAMLAVVLLFYIVREHWDHLAGGWVYLLLLLCPLLHLFWHGHQHEHNEKGSNDAKKT